MIPSLMTPTADAAAPSPAKPGGKPGTPLGAGLATESGRLARFTVLLVKEGDALPTPHGVSVAHVPPPADGPVAGPLDGLVKPDGETAPAPTLADDPLIAARLPTLASGAAKAGPLSEDGAAPQIATANTGPRQGPRQPAPASLPPAPSGPPAPNAFTPAAAKTDVLKASAAEVLPGKTVDAGPPPLLAEGPAPRGPVRSAPAQETAPPRGLIAEPAAQIAKAVLANPSERVIEVRLDPPSLGRVRIELDFSGDAVRAVVSAAEPEALGALRRGHAGLARDLSELGLGEAQIEYAEDDRPDAPVTDEGAPIAFADADLAEASPETPTPRRPVLHDGALDIVL